MWKADDVNRSSSNWESTAADVVNSSSGWPSVAAAAAKPSSDEWPAAAGGGAQQQQQLGGASSSSNAWMSSAQSRSFAAESSSVPVKASSWSEIARKNVPSSVGAQQQLQSSAAASQSFGGKGAAPPTAAVRRGGNDWGKPVDQGTPWEVGAAAAAAGAASSRDNKTPTAAMNNTDPSPISAAAAAASLPSAWPSRRTVVEQQHSWQQQPSANSLSAAAVPTTDNVYWKAPYDKDQWPPAAANPPPPAPVALRTPAAVWDDQQHSSNSSRPSAWLAPEQPTNVWTGPPSQPDSSMVWNNPYPKKTAAFDKGTTIWGNPNSQGEIHRWKSSGEEPMNFQQPSLMFETPMESIGSAAVCRAPVTPMHQVTSQQSSSCSTGSTAINSGSVWNDSPMAPRMNRPISSSFSGNSPAWPAADAQGLFNMSGLINTLENSANNAWTNEGGDASSALLNNQQKQQQPQSSAISSAMWMDSTTTHSASKSSSRRDSDNRQSVDSDAVPSEDVFTGNSTFGKAVLASQVAEQLTAAIKAGLIESHVLSQPLPPDTLYKLNQLLLCNTKSEQSQQELNYLIAMSQKSPLSGVQQYEYQRLTGEMTQLREKALMLRAQISSQAASLTSSSSVSSQKQRSAAANNYCPSTTVSNDLATAAITSSMAAHTANQHIGADSALNGSKLLHWKHSDIVMDKAQNGGGGDDDVSDKRLVGFEFSSDAWSPAAAATKRVHGAVLDWPPPSSMVTDNYDAGADGSGAFGGEEGKGSNGGDGGGGQQSQSSSSMVDDGPPEFRPGQKWEWRDPREVADDPNATPGSVKSSAISLTRLPVDSKLNCAAVSASHTTAMDVNYVHHSKMVYPSAAAAADNIFSRSTSSYDSKFAHISSSANSPSSASSAVFSDGCWSAAKNVRSPLSSGLTNVASPFNVGPRMPGRIPSSTSSSMYPSSSPYLHMPNANPQWVLLTSVNLIDESTLQFYIARVGVPQTFILPPGSGIAALKFKDVPAERAVQRLQQDFASSGVSVHLAKDSEVEKLIRGANSQRQAVLQHSGPLNHHNGLMWDVPPPQPPPPHHHMHGSWGPPGHHGYGPPPPPPGVALPDHVAFMPHGTGTAPIYGDAFYGGMDHHSAY